MYKEVGNSFCLKMATSLSKPPVPRPRQCWQENQKISSASSPSATSNTRIQLSDDDVYRFLGKEFCLPRSPASSRPASSATETKPAISSNPVTSTGTTGITITATAGTTAATRAPPKPPRSVNVTKSVDAAAAGYSKAPKPLPRTMFLAIKTPPLLPSRPPIVYSSGPTIKTTPTTK